MLTIVLSGPTYQRSNLTLTLRNAGIKADESDYPQGFEPVDGNETFVTVHHSDLDAVVRAAEVFGFTLRKHHAPRQPYHKPTDPIGAESMIARLDKLEAQLRAHGIKVSD
jgi:hypothetical protein